MKTKNKPHFLLMAAIVAVFAAFTVSCNKDDDPSLADLREDKLQYLEDSLRISDSLRLIGNAGVVNYAITVVDGSTSSIFANGRTNEAQSAVDGAIVTISQYGKTLTDTTDASGTVVFNGFFRSAVNVTVRKADFTSVSYVSAVHIQDSTRTGTISFVGNLIPIFALTGANTATISGRATIETNLTNRTVELAPDGTTVTASIDATNNSDFSDKFLTTDIDDRIYQSSCGCEFVYVGNILQASYATGVIGSVTGGNYSITVPAAIDSLPMTLAYSDIAADQTLFQLDGDDQIAATKRVVFTANSSATPAALPNSASAVVGFESYSVQAQGTARISTTTGAIDHINVMTSGAYYTGTPLVQIDPAPGDFTGSGATATAVVTNGRVTSINIGNAGSGYQAPPIVSLISGFGADFSTVLTGTSTVIGVNLLTSGAGYTSAPTVTITGGGATTDATASAVVSGGRVTGLTLLTPGAGYTGVPTISITGGGATVNATAAVTISGRSIGEITTIDPGQDYVYAPTVTFDAPDLPNGVRAQGSAVIDLVTRTVVAINVTNSGSGYLNPPGITLNAGDGNATAQAFLAGGSVTTIDITNEGADYAYPPTIVFDNEGNGSGAAATPIMSGGRVVGITITNGGSGYTGVPDVTFVSGSGAVAYPVVNNNGAITSYNVVKGGSGYNGAPRVVITNAGGNNGVGATATATAAGGAITAITAVNGGSNYEAGNTPSTAVGFSTTKGTTIHTKPGISVINDIKYGTGTIRD